MNKAVFVLILRILLGAVFIFSGIAKLDSIYQFEQMIFKAGVSNWNIIPYLSRLTIAAEIFLGLCFFHKEGLKKFTIPATAFMLIFFSLHLGYTIVTEGGSSGNCGCFGEKFSMTPWESLIKNIVMLGMLFYLFKTPIEKAAKEVAIPISLAVITLAFVWQFFPVKPYVTSTPETVATTTTDNLKTEAPDSSAATTQEDTIVEAVKVKSDTKISLEADKGKKEILKGKVNSSVTPEPEKTQEVKKADEPKLLPKTTSIYAPFKNFSDGVTTDLDEGIKIVTMYNTGCDHCMENAKKICELRTKLKLPETRILFWGNESEIPAFFEFTKCKQPYKFLEPQIFFPLLGKGNFPKIILLNNGNVVGEWEGDDSPAKLEAAIVEMKK